MIWTPSKTTHLKQDYAQFLQLKHHNYFISIIILENYFLVVFPAFKIVKSIYFK